MTIRFFPLLLHIAFTVLVAMAVTLLLEKSTIIPRWATHSDSRGESVVGIVGIACGLGAHRILDRFAPLVRPKAL